MDANTRLMEMQDKQMTIIEKDDQSLDDILEYYFAVKDEYLILAAARKAGVAHIGLQRVPSLQVSESKYREAVTMIIIVQSLQNSQFKNVNFTLRDLQYQLVMQAPAFTIKKGPKTVYVTYSGPDKLTVTHTKWKDIYYQRDEQWRSSKDLQHTHDPNWFRAHTLTDSKGLFYVDIYGDVDYYVLFNSGEPQNATRKGQWEISTSPPDARTSTDTPSRKTPERHIVAITPPIRNPRNPAYQSKPTHPTPTKPTHTSTVTTRRGNGRGRGLGGRGGGGGGAGGSTTRRPFAEKQSPVSAEEVGRTRETVQGTGTRLERLLKEARDPPGLVFEGSTAQIKHIRRRVEAGSLKYSRVTSTWHWISGKKVLKPSKMIVVFNNEKERSTFLNLFRVEGDGITVRLCSFNGL
ncbi:E2 regulatory protein [Caretta caretta papillomavirus 1]|uniref:Protein E8^E2C n=1 Tax=Caretta caretta papillomavirus 1 TaxID=485241 RepID=B6RUQ1_9PAPI|nr:E2 regulatory protein [Caretta caretta papillomavirus 1]ACD39815.1 E2 regulatory protein [Caretta caretta papillomavirus 1]